MGKTNLASNMGENLISNPFMDYVQRNTTFPNITVSGTYTLDRYKIQMAGGYDVTVDQDALVPADSYGVFSYKLTNNVVVDQDGGGSRFLAITQPIEGYNIRKLRKRSALAIFQARSSVPGIYSLNCTNSGGDRFLVQEFEITSADTWTNIALDIPTVPTDVGTWDFTNGIGMNWSITLSADATNRGAANAWGGGAAKASTNQVNFGNTLNATFYFTDVQVQEGIDSSSLGELARDPGSELSLCQRYLEKQSYGAAGYTNGNYASLFPIMFNTAKRDAPIFTIHGSFTNSITPGTVFSATSSELARYGGTVILDYGGSGQAVSIPNSVDDYYLFEAEL